MNTCAMKHSLLFRFGAIVIIATIRQFVADDDRAFFVVAEEIIKGSAINNDKFSNIVIDSLDDLEQLNYYDESGKLATHLLLYPKTCSSLVNEHLILPHSKLDEYNGVFVEKNTFFNRKAHPVSGSAEKAFFGTTNAGFTMDCNLVCIERGVDKSLVQYPMPHLYYKERHNNSEHENNDRPVDQSFFSWYKEKCESVEFAFLNYHSADGVHISYIDPLGEPATKEFIPYGMRHFEFVQTYIGHKFRISDVNGTILFDHVVEFTGIRPIGQYVVTEERKRDHEPSVDGKIRNEMDFHWNNMNRVKRKFSRLGFDKGRLPNDVFGSMGAYHYNNHKSGHHYQEEQTANGVVVNWWEQDVHFFHMPYGLKSLWQMRLLKLVEKWADTRLEQTSIYGIRQYEAGARLITHIDILRTHAASLIVNIAQGETNSLSNPWPVEIYDHDNRLHEIAMEPGDILYYESAKCLHGRTATLQGGYFANLFTHYRPVGDPNWYEKEEENKEFLNIDDNPTLSSTGFVARNGNDLYRWWKKNTIKKSQAVLSYPPHQMFVSATNLPSVAVPIETNEPEIPQQRMEVYSESVPIGKVPKKVSTLQNPTPQTTQGPDSRKMLPAGARRAIALKDKNNMNTAM